MFVLAGEVCTALISHILHDKRAGAAAGHVINLSSGDILALDD